MGTLGWWVVAAVAVVVSMVAPGMLGDEKPPAVERGQEPAWIVHDVTRPAPTVVAPGRASTAEQPGQAPADAVVLFDGTDLSKWTDKEGKAPRWVVKEHQMEPTPGSGLLVSRQKFGSCQLHIEFATPSPPLGDGQGRGNSGVFLMSTYEIQILDSFDNRTYADGQCAALYGRTVPLVNACREPGEWQSYDVVSVHRPIFVEGKVVRRATFTVFHNGVLVHDHVVLEGGTDWRGPHEVAEYEPHEERLPLALQDHGNPVRFRNIRVRELPD